MANRKLGRGVAVVGAGMTRFGAFPGLSSRDLFVEAFQDMLASVEQGFNPRTNDITALAERQFVVGWDCLTAAVLFTPSCCCE